MQSSPRAESLYALFEHAIEQQQAAQAWPTNLARGILLAQVAMHSFTLSLLRA